MQVGMALNNTFRTVRRNEAAARQHVSFVVSLRRRCFRRVSSSADARFPAHGVFLNFSTRDIHTAIQTHRAHPQLGYHVQQNREAGIGSKTPSHYGCACAHPRAHTHQVSSPNVQPTRLQTFSPKVLPRQKAHQEKGERR